MPTISFLILTYNSTGYVKQLFDSLMHTLGDDIKKGKYEIVIVDNASTDDTPRYIEEYFKDGMILDIISEQTEFHKNIRMYIGSKNLGYAKGINLAAKFAKGNIVVALNPDAQLTDGNFNDVIEAFSQNKKLAIAGLSIENYEGKREKTAGTFFNWVTFFLYAVGLENALSLRFAPDKNMKVDYVSGGFVAFDKKAFEELGGYDEDYFMYVEDMDICLRAKKRGYEVNFITGPRLKHKGQGSSNREFAIVNIYKGLILFYQKHESFMAQMYVKNLLSLKAAIIIFMSAVSGKKELGETYSKALKAIS